MASLTKGQERVLEAMRTIERNGRPATIRELCAQLGLRSTNGIVEHLRKLRARGLVLHHGGARGWTSVTGRNWTLEQRIALFASIRAINAACADMDPSLRPGARRAIEIIEEVLQ